LEAAYAIGVEGNTPRLKYDRRRSVPDIPIPEESMAKGDQKSNKMAKKPKKDTSPPKPGTSDRPTPPTTTVIPRGKIKTK
jgi:hypothetical protein